MSIDFNRPHRETPAVRLTRAQKAFLQDLHRATALTYDTVIERVSVQHYGRVSHYSPIKRDWLDAVVAGHPHITIIKI